MKTLGELLKNARKKKNLSLVEVERITKIRKEFLKALEDNKFDLLPSFVSALGFVKNYAKFLGLSEQEALALFRRDYKKPVFDFSKRSKFKKTSLETPKSPVLILALLVFLGVGGFLGYQYFSLKRPPLIKVYSPSFSQETTKERIEIKGKTDPEALLKINHLPVVVSLNGEFSFWVDLFPGENKILIEAENKQGKKSKLEWIIFRLDKDK